MELSAHEIKYLENEIKKRIASISHEHFQYTMNIQMTGYEEEYPGWTIDWIRSGLQNLYLLVAAYIESRKMPGLLQVFLKRFENTITDNKKLIEDELPHPEGEVELKVLSEYKKFLDIFKTFDFRELKEDETKKLTSILRNSGHIVNRLKVKIRTEPDIYKQVKWIIDLYYPSSRNKNKAAFIQNFKTYNPDILIPELRTAIEYKYLKDNSDNIDDFIDQVRTDANNYVDDYRYDTFFAVMYISDPAIATPESIQVAWDAKRFPDNWSLVITGASIIK